MRLDERFGSLDRTPAPDLWARIEAREPGFPAEPVPSPARRLGIALLAFAVAGAAFAFVVMRFDREVRPGVELPSPRSNGVILFRVGGGDAGWWWETIREDGSDRTEVSSLGEGQPWWGQVSWRSDGARVASVVWLESGYAITSSEPDGSDRVQLTDGVNDLAPSWSPDGSRIVFASTRGDPAQEQCTPGDTGSMAVSCPTDLYVMDADGSNVIRLTDTARPESFPEWSPDGSSIAFTAGTGRADIRTAVFLMDADGSDVRQVSSGDGGSDFAPSWSPDGSRLVFTAMRNEEIAIWSVAADGTDERLLVGGSGPYVESPVWAPDGSAIAFVGEPQLAGAEGTDLALLAMDPDGSQVRLLAAEPRYGIAAGDVSWQPLPPDDPIADTTQAATATAVVTDRIQVAQFPNAVAVGEGSVWVAAPRNDVPDVGHVLRIDPSTSVVEARIPVDHLPTWEFGGAGMAVGLGSVWVSGSAPDGDQNAETGCCVAVVQRIDPMTNTVADEFVAGPGFAQDVWVDDSGVWVLRREDSGERNHVAVGLDPSSGQILSETVVPLDWSQTIFAAGGDVWAFGHVGGDDVFPDTLVRVDADTGSVIDTVHGHGPCSPIPAGDRIWLDTERGYGRYDPATGSIDVYVDAPGCGVLSQTSDGAGGLWLVETTGSGKQYRHVTADGAVDLVVDAGGDRDLVGGQHIAYDPETQTFWFAQVEDVMIRVAFR